MGKLGDYGHFHRKYSFCLRLHTTAPSFIPELIKPSQAQTVFALAAAASATAIYGAVTGVFESVLKPYHIEASMGSKMLSVLWLAVAFSVGSGFFWLVSVCCCSGKSGHKKVVVEKTPYTYERVSSPAFGQTGHQLQHQTPYGQQQHSAPTAYEPFRQQHV